MLKLTYFGGIIGFLIFTMNWVDSLRLSSPVVIQPISSSPDSVHNKYVDDKTCASCHRDLYDSFQEVGMAQAFYKPGEGRFIEDFENNSYFHVPSQRTFKMVRRDDQLFFQRYQNDENGEIINFYERQVDWILGSGNKSRTYLFQTENGEIFQFPLTWYTESQSWRMAPGFESRNEVTLGRQVLRECMFCHNAYPNNMEKTNTMHWETDDFETDLPRGIGCQRCHGPGENHIAQVILSSGGDQEKIRSSIVNPAKLDPKRRDDVCNQCHLQPAIALMGVRRFDKGYYDFRPGERLSDYLLHIDVEEPDMPKADRFEINHHAYRLYQSPCFKESDGVLGCISCHDPHKKIKEPERLSHYRDVCLKCHQPHGQKKVPYRFAEIALDDCAACHMPQHRAQDVVNVTVTDHFIRRRPPAEDWLKEREEKMHIVTGIEFLEKDVKPEGALGDAYLADVVLRSEPDDNTLDFFEKKLREGHIDEITPYYDLAKGQLDLGRNEAALQTVKFILRQHPNSELALSWKGIAELRTQGVDVAISTFKSIISVNPKNVNAHYNLGIALEQKANFIEKTTYNLTISTAVNDIYQEAVSHFKEALRLRENFAASSMHLAQCLLKLNDETAALDAYRRALEIEPAFAEAYIGIGELLIKQGKTEEAKRYWKHGIIATKQPDLIRNHAKNAGVVLE